ncbi:MAG: hypothetical protein LBU76_03735 [Azoarcus sp.]|jgi:hypothetical protein|nr:hypothetical protein [Azoarcus sp.]
MPWQFSQRTGQLSRDGHGRTHFLIHGDSMTDPGNASQGCIVLRRELRDAIAVSGDNFIEVVE